MSKNTFRGRARGRGQRHQPYSRRRDEGDNRLPRPTSEQLLSGRTAEERATARERDNLRLANDWKSHFECYFERERYHLLRPSDSHLVPEADTLNNKIDEILQGAKLKIRETVNQHFDSIIEATEERISNPPKPMESNIMEQVNKLIQQQQRTYELTEYNMGRTMNEVLQQREERQRQQTDPKEDTEAKQ